MHRRCARRLGTREELIICLVRENPRTRAQFYYAWTWRHSPFIGVKIRSRDVETTSRNWSNRADNYKRCTYASWAESVLLCPTPISRDALSIRTFGRASTFSASLRRLSDRMRRWQVRGTSRQQRLLHGSSSSLLIVLCDSLRIFQCHECMKKI